ncbi:MAG: RagB/SusD family nutrient uptake outer membrane protein [Pedobacter sp.]|nr:MAG: RagB/SusD family nutrient uptake outer membrane protein [Pedobacter sp.]
MKKLIKIKKLPGLVLLLIAMSPLLACKKTWLDEKPKRSLVVPTTIQDLQAILDNAEILNGTVTGVTPNIGEASADNYYLTFSDWQGRPEIERNAHVWAGQIYENNTSIDWNRPYRAVYYANVVLDALPELKKHGSNYLEIDRIEGAALFHRAYMFYCLASIYGEVYSATDDKLGIPIKITSDLNEKIKRSTLPETYNQIIGDLNKAVELLPETELYKTRPTKTAAHALLSRIYLSMNDYDKSLLHASAALDKFNILLDFNTLTASAAFPIQRFNNETIYYSIVNSSALWSTRHKVDETLFALYHSNDLRRTVYFRVNADGSKIFKGSYNGSSLLFSGIATDELLLNRSECLARKDEKDIALSDLNTLLKARFKTGTFTPVTATTASEALSKILLERRKELVFRGIRWSDLKRLNEDANFATTITRSLNGTTYTLPPKSSKYILPIPDDVIAANPGMPQNQR